jgi:hypothetical protein
MRASYLFAAVFHVLFALDALRMAMVAILQDATFHPPKVGFLAERSAWFHATVLFFASVCALVSVVAPARRRWALLGAAFFNLYYLSNGIDGFQHHYLLCILLVLVPLAEEDALAMRVLDAQVAIVYFYTARTKFDTAFLTGDILALTTLSRRTHGLVHFVAETVGVEDLAVFRASAWYVLAAELALCAALLARPYLSKRARVTAFALGVLMHAGIEIFGRLVIGFFSYYMIVILALLMGPRVS